MARNGPAVVVCGYLTYGGEHLHYLFFTIIIVVAFALDREISFQISTHWAIPFLSEALPGMLYAPCLKYTDLGSMETPTFHTTVHTVRPHCPHGPWPHCVLFHKKEWTMTMHLQNDMIIPCSPKYCKSTPERGWSPSTYESPSALEPLTQP